MTDEFVAWKASQARPWAEQVRREVVRLEQRQAALEQWRDKMLSVSGVDYSKVGGASPIDHGDDSMAAKVIRMEELKEQYADSIAEYAETVKRFERALRQLDGIYDALLTAYYMRGMTWREVAEAMRYTEGYVRDDLLTNALAALFDVMPHELRGSLPQAL